MRYTAIQTFSGYEIRDNVKRWYIAGIHSGKPTWTLDYTYARKFSKKQADALLLLLNK